jgi:hypothetical protein
MVPGDANRDGRVDVGDLGILAAHYGTVVDAVWAQGDFNGDMKVDVGDLGILAAHYGEGTGGSPNFSRDAGALGLTVPAEEPEAQTAETQSSATQGCGPVGLPIVIGFLLAFMIIPVAGSNRR